MNETVMGINSCVHQGRVEFNGKALKNKVYLVIDMFIC